MGFTWWEVPNQLNTGGNLWCNMGFQLMGSIKYWKYQMSKIFTYLQCRIIESIWSSADIYTIVDCCCKHSRCCRLRYIIYDAGQYRFFQLLSALRSTFLSSYICLLQHNHSPVIYWWVSNTRKIPSFETVVFKLHFCLIWARLVIYWSVFQGNKQLGDSPVDCLSVIPVCKLTDKRVIIFLLTSIGCCFLMLPILLLEST